MKKPDLFLFAGDMINFGKTGEYQNVSETIEQSFGKDVPIVACFGNEEFSEGRSELRSLVGERITFLDEERAIFDFDEYRIGVVGAAVPISSRDRHDKSTDDIREMFEVRTSRLSQLIEDTSNEVGFTIFLIHYSPLLETSIGKGMDSFSGWIAKAIEEQQPDLVIHGHIHRADRRRTLIGKTIVINVAFPNYQEVTEYVIHDYDFHRRCK
jgi:Icc-related predicted phosphoesterase